MSEKAQKSARVSVYIFENLFYYFISMYICVLSTI